MRRWAMVFTSFIFIIFASKSIYATENINIQSNGLLNDGRIVIDFMAMDTYEENSPVKDINVELLFLVDNEMVDIRQIEELNNITINLVSDENGKIVLNNLPFGLYQYRIVSAPNGFEYNSEFEYIEVDLLNKNVHMDVYLTRKIEMAEGSTIVVEEPKEEIEDKKDNIDENIKNEQIILSPTDKDEVKEEIVIEDTTEALKTNINKLSLDIYSYTENETVENKKDINVSIIKKDNDENREKIIKNTIAYVRERMRSINQQMIKKFKEYKISDSIKIAINTLDDTMNTYRKAITDIPSDKKNKKMRRQTSLMCKVKDIKNERLYNLPIVKARVR